MAHGGDASHLPINFNSLELSPFSYIALGHIHKPHIVGEGKMAYCGSPEPLDLTETGAHGYYAGEVHPLTRKLTSLQFIPAASLQYIPLAVNVDVYKRQAHGCSLRMSGSDKGHLPFHGTSPRSPV